MFINEKHIQANEFIKEGKLEEAINLINELLAEYPSYPDLYSDRGVAYIHLNDKEACFRDLNKAIELDEKYAFRYACRAYAKNHFGDIDGAVEDYTIAVELDPDDAVAHNNLGLLLEQKGYADEAKKRFERADKLSKLEDHLFEMMDEMEHSEKSVKQEPIVEAKPVKQETTISGVKKILTSKSEFRSFLLFIRNGFKLK